MHCRPHPHPSRTVLAIVIALAASSLTAFSQSQKRATAKAPAPQSTKVLFEQARAEFYRGNLNAARAKFNRVLQRHPNHTVSQGYLAQINQIAANQSGNLAMERRFQNIVFPEVDIDRSTLTEIVEYLTLLTNNHTKGTIQPNILLRGLHPDQQDRTFTLRLSNVPLSYVLEAIGQQAGIEFRYEKYAVVGAPLPRTGSRAPAAPTVRKPFWERDAEKKADTLFD